MELYIRIYLVCWFFTNFEPIQNGIDWIFERIETKLNNVFWQVLSCQYCLTFWLSFIVTQNIVVALALSALAQIHAKIIKP